MRILARRSDDCLRRIARVAVPALFVLAAAQVPRGEAARSHVRASTFVEADSVTVGERFSVRFTFEYPDSLRSLAPERTGTGNCRVLEFRFPPPGPLEGSPGWRERTARVRALTTDLESARMPALVARFVTPSGDTVRAAADDVSVPVRSIVAPGDSLAPLKEQWSAPRGVPAWVWLAAALALALGVGLWWWRRRARRENAVPAEPPLPADYRALAELSRIERDGLVERGEFKPFYSQVTGVLRRYLGERFGVEAMESTSDELVSALGAGGTEIDGLAPVLAESDLVKFARYTPSRESADELIAAARRIVVRTAPRPAVVDGVERGAPPPDSGGSVGVGST